MLGRVRLAKNVNNGQLAAVKIVPKSLTPTARKKDDGKGKAGADKVGDTGLSYSIEREVVIMKLIEHPNVMSLYDVWENRGELYSSLMSALIVDTLFWNILKAGSYSITWSRRANWRKRKQRNTFAKSLQESHIVTVSIYGTL